MLPSSPSSISFERRSKCPTMDRRRPRPQEDTDNDDADTSGNTGLLAFAEESPKPRTTNPYRQRQANRSISETSDTNSIGRRKRTPIFSDLPTAHSSITKTRYNNVTGERMYEMQDFRSSANESSTSVTEYPLPPLPAFITQNRRQNSNELYSLAEEGAIKPDKRHSVFSNIKHALASMSSNAGRGPSDTGKAQVVNLPDNSTFDSSPENPAYENLRRKKSTGDIQLWARNKPSLQSDSVEESVPERSTVGNIYQHYRVSENHDDGVEMERKNLPPPPPALWFSNESLQHPKQRQEKKTLDVHDQTTRIVRQGTSANTEDSEAIPISSSLEGNYARSQQSNLTGDHGPFEYAISDVANSTLPSLPNVDFRNPYKNSLRRSHGGTGSKRRSHADPSDCVYEEDPGLGHEIEDRVPLERDVSEALRRASGYSGYSYNSISSSILEQGNPKYATYRSTGPSSGDRRGGAVQGEGDSTAGTTGLFYDQTAIPPRWVNNKQHVRVPVNHRRAHAKASPSPSLRGRNSLDGHPRYGDRTTTEDDDWETLGENHFGRDQMLFGGEGVKRTGSSIAATNSDAGTDSMIPEVDVDVYGSTERITQHPASIRYFGDYRQRDLKNSNIPVMLPVYTEHKVNGYLADSTRIRPSPNYHVAPAPLTRHQHPFKCPPPDVRSPPRRGKRQNTLAKKIFAPSSSTSSRARHHHHVEEPMLAPNTTPSAAAQDLSGSFSWMNGPGQPELASIYRSDQQFLGVTEEQAESRPNSWAHVMKFGRGETVPGYNQDGTRISTNMNASRISPDQAPESKLRNLTAEGTVDTAAADHPSQRNKPLLPGAFYQGLHRSQSGRRVSSSAGRLQAPRKAAPTNKLRPLSLVMQREERDQGSSSPHSGPGEFVYRSPLAPPKRESWRLMYTSEQLAKFDEQAKDDGMYHPAHSQQFSNDSDGIPNTRLHQAPTLRHPSANAEPIDYDGSRCAFSAAVLIACNFLFPLLLLYRLGRLDWLMKWWSEGEFSSFTRTQKKWAIVIFSAWCIATFIGLVYGIITAILQSRAR